MREPAPDAEISLRPMIVATLGLGVVMLAGVGLMGDLWPTGGGAQKQHINDIVSALFFAFQANLIVLCLAYAVFRKIRRLIGMVNAYGALVFLSGIIYAGLAFDRLLHSGAEAPPLDALVPPGLEFLVIAQIVVMAVLLLWGGAGLLRGTRSPLQTQPDQTPNGSKEGPP